MIQLADGTKISKEQIREAIKVTRMMGIPETERAFSRLEVEGMLNYIDALEKQLDDNARPF